jgi:putative DNA-invertase from lambdoid prophage Rac
MRDYVAERGWNIALEIQDVGSGASLRPKREKLLEARRQQRLDRIVLWRLDRWGWSPKARQCRFRLLILLIQEGF